MTSFPDFLGRLSSHNCYEMISTDKGTGYSRTEPEETCSTKGLTSMELECEPSYEGSKFEVTATITVTVIVIPCPGPPRWLVIFIVNLDVLPRTRESRLCKSSHTLLERVSSMR